MKHYINGRCVTGNGPQTRVVNPATEEIVTTEHLASGSQALEALEAASGAFPIWSAMSINQRGQWINKLADAIESERERMLDLLMAETGKPLVDAERDFVPLISTLRFFVEEVKRMSGEIIPDYDDRFIHLITRQPVGVVIGYVAWNFPLLNMGFKLGPILASGCTCVMKPSSKTPLASLYIGEIAERIGFPAGVLNIISGLSEEVSPVLNTSNLTKMITLIGSSAVGHQIVAESSNTTKRYSLELGGNAPVVVMPDADIVRVAEILADFKYRNAGQICIAPNRVLVHERVHDRLIDLLRDKISGIRLGWGRTDHPVMGPLITRGYQQRMASMVADAVAKGAVVVSGGRIPTDRPKGFFFEPTLLDHADMSMKVCHEEIFGPILPVITFRDRDEALELANTTEYGLVAYLYAHDMNDVLFFSERLEAGSILVNHPVGGPNLPHGGIKESGVGKDNSRFGLEEYYYIKRTSIEKRRPSDG